MNDKKEYDSKKKDQGKEQLQERIFPKQIYLDEWERVMKGKESMNLKPERLNIQSYESIYCQSLYEL